jgi:regulator of sigma D
MRKNVLFAVMALSLVFSLTYGQAQNQECLTNLSIYVESAKVKNYDAAYEPWKLTYEACPELNRANYLYGERILKHKIENSEGEEHDAYVALLLKVYDDAMKYFQSRYPLASVVIDKVLLQRSEGMISDEEIFSQLDQAFKADREDFNNPQALYLYFSSLVDLNAAGKRDIQEVFDVYDEVVAKIEEENKKLTDQIAKLLPLEEDGTIAGKDKQRLRVYSTNSASFGKVAASVDAKLGALADCDNLVPLYEKSYDARKTDVKWVKSAVGRMFGKDCTDSPMFRKLFEAQIALEPSADAYLYGGTLKQKAGDITGALADFNKSAELETDNYKKSNILYKIATIVRKSNKVQARNYLNQSIKANPSNGRAYLLLAALYADSANECGESQFDKRAVYWLAAKTADRAGRVDPSLRSTAAKAVESYNAKAPSKTDIFNSGRAGETITFSCWVGGSVTVPSL